MKTFRAYRIHEQDGRVEGRLESIDLDALSPGNVVIRAVWSDVNYKDALAGSGKGKILKRFPLVGGIDVSGRVHSSDDPRFKEGDAVLVAGCGLSENHDGGYAEYVRVPGDWVVALPDGLSLRDAMAIGTAGFTAGIAVDRMEHNGQGPDGGPILVNGATGGVGGFAIDMFSGLGYQVTAFTGKHAADDYLTTLGASNIIYRGEVEMGTRPMEKALWGGAVDSVGGDELAWLTRTVMPGGNIASIGLAGGVALNTTVLPFILRGVNLLGINSVYISTDIRDRVWKRLGSDLRPRHFDQIVTRTVDLDALPGVFDEYVAGTNTGRTLVKISQD
jgi:acrylyl-CoA reductase (NADPH)